MSSRLTVAVLVSGSTLAFACGAPPVTKEAPVAAASAAITPEAPANRASYGAKIGAADKVALDDILKDPSHYADKTIRTEGVITAVCQGAGCWLEIGDERSKAHVKLGGHKFFVPRSSAGKHAEVEARVLPVVDEGHCEEEAAEQTGKIAKVELLATGVELF